MTLHYLTEVCGSRPFRRYFAAAWETAALDRQVQLQEEEEEEEEAEKTLLTCDPAVCQRSGRNRWPLWLGEKKPKAAWTERPDAAYAARKRKVVRRILWSKEKKKKKKSWGRRCYARGWGGSRQIHVHHFRQKMTVSGGQKPSSWHWDGFCRGIIPAEDGSTRSLHLHPQYCYYCCCYPTRIHSEGTRARKICPFDEQYF